MQSFIAKQLQDHLALFQKMEAELTAPVAELAERLIETFKIGNKLLIMGNGGSAADAQHFAGEIVSRFRIERPGLPAIALSTDTSIITAIGNDYGFERIFSRQVEALAVPGDAVIGISTSGNSPNVQKALEVARQAGCTTIGLLGKDGGSIKAVCDIPLIIPSNDTPRVQEGHIAVIHILCDLIEQGLFGIFAGEGR
ncbi:D-sedoheptulose 7-phosphate isomerase [Trichlorobacter lovleyi]|uniref:Phosphoheptose isomerase n=1 Tax=Trichlorobacter lovleyi (strain ATCC BAA-1151 / DSM 17278 / SZ) TaxID=398767 RepID=GMHA_TRIL1|nr:D-sedoheptulose 7-phosphate isomerase [Trichlorobacter lovleyi]B3E5N0.1 RecName: Full=Phosphoheptose isomerase; AltName: Full=Sedoheptulose 7-phosphate isomerase [Trichlorobacter lovleyi SZ]ACD94701.1 phosphoheptose isomerase [Trichlorobacter lovleyi SZ]